MRIYIFNNSFECYANGIDDAIIQFYNTFRRDSKIISIKTTNEYNEDLYID